MKKNLTKNEIQDYRKWFVEKPDGDFSPGRNEYVIKKSIEKYEKKRKERAKRYNEAVAERVDAAMSFIKHLEKHGDPYGNAAERYFGRRELARLRGQKIMQEIKGNMKVLDYIE